MKMSMRFLCGALSACFSLPLVMAADSADAKAPAVEPLDGASMKAEAFLEVVRQPPLANSWARMGGVVEHKATRKKTQKFRIEVRARFRPNRIQVQVQFNKRERYTISQGLKGKGGKTEVKQVQAAGAGEVSLSDVGLEAGDLALSFLHWDYVEEYVPEREHSQQCRRMKLVDPKTGNYVVAWLSVKYFFPVKVEWWHPLTAMPYRELLFTDFRRVNDLWLVSGVKILNPKWKTLVKLRNIKADVVTEKSPVPEDLFDFDKK